MVYLPRTKLIGFCTFSVLCAVSFLVPGGDVHAYIGPGAGFAMATSLMLFIATILLTLLGGLLFPYLFLRKMIKRWGQ